jgi:hypothetical protein
VVIGVVLHPGQDDAHVVVKEFGGGGGVVARGLPDPLAVHVVARRHALLAEVGHDFRREVGARVSGFVGRVFPSVTIISPLPQPAVHITRVSTAAVAKGRI